VGGFLVCNVSAAGGNDQAGISSLPDHNPRAFEVSLPWHMAGSATTKRPSSMRRPFSLPSFQIMRLGNQRGKQRHQIFLTRRQA
jgi:hypothetical protein